MQQKNPFDQFDAPANGMPPGSVMIAPANPFDLPKDEATLANTRANTQRTQQQINQDAATAPYDAQKAAADARTAQANATKAERDLQAQQATASPEQQKAMAALANDEILTAIAKARQDIQRAGAAGYAARLPGFAQPQSTIDLSGSLSTIASRLTLDKLAVMKASSPTGASGLGTLTEKEGALLRDSVAGLDQRQSPDRLLENLAAVERHYRNYAALTNGEDYRNPAVASKYGSAMMPGQEGKQDKVALAQGQYREEADPALRGVNSRIRAMVGQGASAAQIVSYMNSVQPGLGDSMAGKAAEVVAFRAQNPEVPLSRYAISVENRQVPMSSTRQFVNQVAQSPIGAYAMGAGDVVTAGTLDNMMANPALARAGMSAIANENPVSSIAGTLTGGALSAGAAEAAALRMGLGRFAPLAGDALYGAAYGAGSTDEGSRLAGAAQGAAISGIGGSVGRRAVRGAGMLFRGVRDPAAKTLREAGVPLTIGQAVRNAGPLGARIAGREDRLAGFSGIGDSINARRREGFQAFNQAAYNEGLAPIGATAMGETGENAVEAAQGAVSNAYANALDNVRLTRDRPFGVDMQAPTAAANRLPGEMGDAARYTLNERVAKGFAQGPRIGSRQEPMNANVVGALPRMGVAPAFLAKDGRVFAGSAMGNHFTAVTPELRQVGIGGTGFVDKTGRFLSREDALAQVRSQGENIRPSPNMGNELDALDYREQSAYAAMPPQAEFRDVPVYGPSTMAGRDFQQAVRGLEQDARAVRNQPYGADFGSVARGARGAMENLLERQAPGTLDAYLNANAAYRNTSILADATAAAMNADGIFTPAQLGQAARQNARQFTGRMSAATTDRPFYELQRAGQQVMPSKVPDSGTAGRMEARGGPGAWVRGVVRNVVNAPLYAESTQPAINTLLLDRPDELVRVGNQLVQRSRIGGIFGAPMALNYSPFAVNQN